MILSWTNYSLSPFNNALTAVSVDKLRVDEADFEVVQHGWLVEVAERSEVILAHQDVGISQVRQVLCLGIQLVLDVLTMTPQNNSILFT